MEKINYCFDIDFLFRLYLMNQQIILLPILELFYNVDLGLTETAIMAGATGLLEPETASTVVSPHTKMAFMLDPLSESKLATVMNIENPIFTNITLIFTDIDLKDCLIKFFSLSTYTDLLLNICHSF